MDISKDHWKVFELRNQNGMSWHKVANEMGVSVEAAKKLQGELRALEPDLYPVETEQDNFHKQNMDKYGRRLYGIDDIDTGRIAKVL